MRILVKFTAAIYFASIWSQQTTTVSSESGNQDYVRACYLTSWSHYRDGRGKFVPEDYIPGLCTHILFAFGWMSDNFTVRAYDPSDLSTTWSKGFFARTNELKKKDPQLNTLLSIGGWTFGTRLFKEMTKTVENRERFIRSAIDFVRKHGFDGLDVDWEYPQGSDDITKFNLLLQELKSSFEQEANATRRVQLLLTAAVSAGESTIKTGYDIPVIAKLLDYAFLMAYDFHGAWETVTGLNSPLYHRKDEIFWKKVWNMDWAANHWYEQGMPKHKIIIGIPTYGRGWTLTNPADDWAVGAHTKGSSKPTPYVKEAGVAAYYELCHMLEQGASRYWHGEHQTPYLIFGDQWFGYDDAESVQNKAEWIKQHGYGGAFVWTLAFDDFNAKCRRSNGKRYPLISIIAEELSGKNPLIVKPIKPSPGNLVEKRPLVPSNSYCFQKPNGFHKDPENCGSFILCLGTTFYMIYCPSGLEFNSKFGYCVDAINSDCAVGPIVVQPGGEKYVWLTDIWTTPMPRFTQPWRKTMKPFVIKDKPKKDFRCTKDGFFRDPFSCGHFYRCVYGISHYFSCPDGLNFDQDFETCVWPHETKCAIVVQNFDFNDAG